MIEQHFLSVTGSAGHAVDVFDPLHDGERVLWRGRAGVAEYAFDKHASLPRWTLPETTELMVTDERVRYACTTGDEPGELRVTSGELRWLWPQHLRVQPGTRDTGRAAAVTQIQLVCGGADGSWPALVLAGGDLVTVTHADRLASVIRQAIARFRVDNADRLGLSTAHARLLARLLFGPEFSNYQGGPGQTVSLQGALLVNRQAAPTGHRPAATAPLDEAPTGRPRLPRPRPPHSMPPHSMPLHAEPAHTEPARAEPARAEPARAEPARSQPARSQPAHSERANSQPANSEPAYVVEPHPPARTRPRVPVGEGATRVITVRPGIAADLARALQAAKAEAAAQEAHPDRASRAADLAARVASLVSRSSAADDVPIGLYDLPNTVDQDTMNSAAEPPPGGGDRFEAVTTNLSERAETIRRAAGRFTTNSAGTKAARHPDRGNRTN